MLNKKKWKKKQERSFQTFGNDCLKCQESSVKLMGRNEVVIWKKLGRKWEIMRKGSREVGKSCETRTKGKEINMNTLTQK
jgi:hypothetical protein